MKIFQITENMSHTAKRIHDIEKEKGVTPGTPEWFKLWFSLPYLKESVDEVYEVTIDNKDGRGAVPNNQEVDYFGKRVKMKPSVFIKLAAKLGREPDQEMIDYIKNGGAIGSPFLTINVDDDNAATVIGHEGRNRMLAVMKAEGDAPVEVHLFFSGKFSRARHIDQEFLDFIKAELISQDNQKVTGNLFNEAVNEATEMKISDLTISDAGMAIAQSAGGGSRTDAPLTVTKLPSGHVYLVNGYHRLIDAMKSGNDTVAVEYVPYEKVEILWKQEREDDIKYGKQFNEAVTEEVSLPQDIFHMKNRLLKVKKITDAMGNRPIMFRSFVYDADRIGKVIKKVTNDSGRKIKTGSNQKQQEVLQKLGVNNPTFANLAAGKHADVSRTSLEDHGVAGLQNIFIPISNEIYYSDAVEDLGMGRSTGGNNISLQSDFDVDKAVASYKKGWPPAGFDNEIIVDTDKYYLLNLQSFLLELTSPDIKDQIKRLKREYDLSYSSNASKNQVDDILKDLFKTKIMTYSNISRWIESVAIPFVDMLGASSVQENFADGKKKGKSTNVLFNLGLAEGYKLQLERDTDMMVLNITDTTTGKRTEVRGKAGYETNGYDKNDKLHQLLDKISKTANISELMNGEPVGINPKHPDGASAKDATTKAFNEAKKASGEKAKMYHWCSNMKSGKKK